jgi:hypothetical protein
MEDIAGSEGIYVVSNMGRVKKDYAPKTLLLL